MKTFLKSLILFFFLLSFQVSLSQENIIISKNVSINIDKSIEVKGDNGVYRTAKVDLNFSGYNGTYYIKCWYKDTDTNLPYVIRKDKRDYIFKADYQGLTSSKKNFKEGKYVIEIKYDGKKYIKEFEIK